MLEQELELISRLGFSKSESEAFNQKRKKQFDLTLERLEEMRDKGMRFWQAVSALASEGNHNLILSHNGNYIDPSSWEGLHSYKMDLIDREEGYAVYIDEEVSFWTNSYATALRRVSAYPKARSIEFRKMTHQKFLEISEGSHV